MAFMNPFTLSNYKDSLQFQPAELWQPKRALHTGRRARSEFDSRPGPGGKSRSFRIDPAPERRPICKTSLNSSKTHMKCQFEDFPLVWSDCEQTGQLHEPEGIGVEKQSLGPLSGARPDCIQCCHQGGFRLGLGSNSCTSRDIYRWEIQKWPKGIWIVDLS